MKRTLLFIACVLTSITMQAQVEGEYESLLSEGKTWTMSYSSPYQEGKVSYVESKLAGDTIIGDIIFKRKYDREWEKGDATPQEWKATDYFVGQDGGKVYYYFKVLNDEPQLLMDFSAKVDDVIPVQIEGTPSGIKVVSVDNTILGSSTDQTLRRCLYVKDTWHNRSDTWIEGIGSMTFGIENYFMNMLTGGIPKFVKCQYNGQTLYDVWPLAQTDYFYYYKGNKIPLTLNENKVVVSIPKDCDDITKRFLANTRTLDKIFDEYFDTFLIRRSDYNKLTMLDSWAEDAKSVILTSSYYTENHEEIFATPYLNVRLKKEEDIDLLTSYAERYKLNIVKKSPLMPLWYTLNITPDSEKNTLECANALYESGYFEASAPDFTNYVTIEEPYRPFIEDGKVWKVGSTLIRDNLVKFVEYYYFDGDTIIDGKTCKQMMCQRYVNPEYPDYAIISQLPTLSYIGAWYEENQKVYLCNEANNQFKLMYDFSVNANDTLQIMGQSYVIGPRQTRGINGFKGVYRDVMMCGEGENTYNTTWLEGVGNIDGPIYSVYLGEEGHALFLMSCTVGDEVIYYNDEYEDGATPEGLGARKRRFDFTHTIKTKPSARMRSGAKQSLYGEYNEQQLSIIMNPIDDAYEVRITDESGKVVYERVVNAGSIVGLNINISAYAKGRYTVTVENNDESFKGEFETQASGIVDVRSKMEDVRKIIHNLQGQRLNTLQKGLNIVNGQKIYVK